MYSVWFKSRTTQQWYVFMSDIPTHDLAARIARNLELEGFAEYARAERD